MTEETEIPETRTPDEKQFCICTPPTDDVDIKGRCMQCGRLLDSKSE